MALPTGCARSAAIEATAEPYSLIIDTDVGVDDLMAIAFLLASPDVRIEAITIGTGLANADAGARNVLKLMALAGRDDIPVYVGRSSNGAAAVRRLVIMGGAVHVAGNLHEAGETENGTAEWNFHIDAEAARRVFAARLPIRLIPLDATDQVPLDRGYIDELQQAGDAPLARLVAQLLGIVAPFMDVGNYYAWDPLAAVTLVDSSVVRTQPMAISIHVQPPEDGRSATVPDGVPNADVAIGAGERRFREVFVRTLTAFRGADS